MYNELGLMRSLRSLYNYYVQPISKLISFKMELQISYNIHTKKKKKCNLW